MGAGSSCSSPQQVRMCSDPRNYSSECPLEEHWVAWRLQDSSSRHCNRPRDFHRSVQSRHHHLISVVCLEVIITET